VPVGWAKFCAGLEVSVTPHGGPTKTLVAIDDWDCDRDEPGSGPIRYDIQMKVLMTKSHWKLPRLGL